MRKAFSLVELSIVLVILGLLVGGILAGQSLIRAAELRSVTTDLDKHRTALFAFRDKYMGLPGDLRNATSFWGDQNVGTGACADIDIPNGTPGTCNGDGNGRIQHGTHTEATRAWQHLSMASLIEGTYSGINTPSAPGTNVPSSRIANAGFAVYWATPQGANLAAANQNRFIFGAPNGGTLSAAALKPEETWNLDTKSDDALPNSGKMIATTGASATGTCFSGSAYSLDNAGIACYFTYVAD